MFTATALSRIPVLRVLTPFIMGILIHRLWHNWWAPLALLALACGAYIWLLYISRSPKGRLRWRPYLAVALAFATLSLGWLCAVIHCPPRLDHSQLTGRALSGRVVNIDYTDFSMRLTVDVIDKDMPRCRVLLSTRGCDYTMRTGDLVSWKAVLEPVGTLGNPDEMNYAAYMIDSRGIRYQQHLPLWQLYKTGHSPTLLTRLADARRHLQLMVFNTSLRPETHHLLVALLLGDGTVVDKATRQEFSAAGVAHILALSGLHVGLIALIIWWLLLLLDRLGWRPMRLLITLVALFLFALFTGLSPGVVRAVVMTGMVMISLLFSRRSLSLNALALAALVILVFDPSALFGVGFQLSFITVSALLLFARPPQWMVSRHAWVNRITALVLASVVAMLATVALTAHYFHTISLFSVISNLLILPVLPVFMVLGALYLLVTAAGLHCQLLDAALDSIDGYFNGVARVISDTPMSHISGVYVSTMGVILWFVLMSLIALWIYRRRYPYMLAAGVTLAVLLAHSIWVDCHTPRQGLIILNSFTSTPVFYFDNHEAYVWIPDDEGTDSLAFARYHIGLLARHGINKIQLFTGQDSLVLDDVMIKPPAAFIMGHRLIAAGSSRWKRATTTKPLALDDIIVTKRFHGTATKLRELYQFNRLIVSSARYDNSPLLRECDSLGINVIDMKTHGALWIR